MSEHKKHGDWCNTVRIPLNDLREPFPKFIRCPKCNRRLKPHMWDTEDHWGSSPHEKPNGPEDLRACIPPHKSKKR